MWAVGKNGAIRLTTARYFTPCGRSIQAKGIDPEIEIFQDLPEELKGRAETSGEAGLRGHLEAEGGNEKSGSQAYVPADSSTDKQLNVAMAILRGDQMNDAFPPDPGGFLEQADDLPVKGNGPLAERLRVADMAGDDALTLLLELRRPLGNGTPDGVFHFEEVAGRGGKYIRPVKVAVVPGAFQNPEPGVRDAVAQTFDLRARNRGIAVSPQDEHRHGDSTNVVVKVMIMAT